MEPGELDANNRIIEAFGENFLAGKTILVTDDIDTNRIVATAVLENFGAKVFEAVSGPKAIELLAEQPVDLILMDIQMPGMDGFEATKIIRGMGNDKPVIAFTAAEIKGGWEASIGAGMNDYLTKPFKEDVLLAMVAKWLKIGIVDIKTEGAKTFYNEALYDLSEIKAISQGNNAFVLQMVNTFCTHTPNMVKEMLDAYRINDLLKVSAIAHKMKPSIDNLEITPLKKIIRSIEKAGKEELDPTTLSNFVEKTSEILTRVVEAMKNEYQL